MHGFGIARRVEQALTRYDLHEMTTETTQPIPADWLADFEAASRRPLLLRLRYAFIHTHKPGLDDSGFRAFETLADYRSWCERTLPAWLGYGRV